MWGGDACVALVLVLCTLSPTCQGDASVPSPHNPSPAPTGTKALPKRCHTIPTLVVARVPFHHVCMLHAIQMKQVKQMTGGRPL